MKTTVELPDELVMRAKQAAVARRTTLRVLVQKGLERELRSPTPDSESPVRRLEGLDRGIWKKMDADRYVKGLRKGWE